MRNEVAARARVPGAAHGSWLSAVDARWIVRGLIALAVLMFAARATADWRQSITSDESLYLSEALSIAHGDVAYSSGEPIVHRAPLYPATLAPVMQLTGNDIDVVRVVPLLYAAAALVALFALGRMLFGPLEAALSVALAAVAAYPAGLSPRFFVDTPEAALVLAAFATLLHARSSERGVALWSAGAGLLLGAAFLMKETAVFWLPLPVLIALLAPSAERRVSLGPIVAWLAGFAVLAGPWFAWVFWHTSAVYKIPTVALAEVGVAMGVVPLIAAVVWKRAPVAHRPVILGAVLLTAWLAAALFVLEQRPEPQSVDYWRTVPSWLVHVFGTAVEPSPLIGLAWLWVVYRAVRGGREEAALALSAVLGIPLLIFVANRGWEPREVMPLIYLSYLALGAAVVRVGARLTSEWSTGERKLAGGALAIALLFIGGFASGLNRTSADANGEPILNWTGADERPTSAMLDTVPPGSVVLSSRLYYSQIYVDHNGRFRIVQLPTLGVRFAEHTTPVQPFGSIFRYEQTSVPFNAPRHWLYLRKHAARDYAIGLAEEDLAASIADQHVDYVLLSGDDAGFSSVSLLHYFEVNPGFTLVAKHAGETVRSYLFAVDRAKLTLQPGPLALDARDVRYMDASLADGSVGSTSFWQALAPQGVLLGGTALIDAQSTATFVRESRPVSP